MNPVKGRNGVTHMFLIAMLFCLTSCSGDSPVVEDDELVPSEENKEPEPDFKKAPDPVVNVNVGRGLVASIRISGITCRPKRAFTWARIC